MDQFYKPINALLTKSRQNTFLALSIGIVYLWFGTLKFFPHLSPAEGLAMDTIHLLTFGYLPSHIAIFLLAMMEVVIGFCFILNIFRRGSIIFGSCSTWPAPSRRFFSLRRNLLFRGHWCRLFWDSTSERT